MKKSKKFASLLLALVMVLSMSMTAFATGDGETPESSGSGGGTTAPGKITIDNAVVDQTYTIYEILRLESYNEEAGTYTYKAATEQWSTFINSDGIKGTYVNVDQQGYVTWVYDEQNKPADAAAFAKAALKYAKETKNDQGGLIIQSQSSVKATATTVEFTNLELGYYLLDSTMGTLCSLDTTDPEVTIKEKNEEPTSVKKVEEDSDPGKIDKEKNDADIGQIVNFQSTITVKEGAENFVFHDEMSEGLTFGSVTKIEKIAATAQTGEKQETETTPATTTLTADTDYTVETSNLGEGDTCTFHVVFQQNFCDTLKDGDQIVISYTATVNEKAVIGGAGNPNKCRLGYGDPGHTRFTTESTTTTYTWKVDVFKYEEEGEGTPKTEKPLAGAVFTLSKNENGSSPIALIKVSEENTTDNPQKGAVYRVAKITDGKSEDGSVTQVTTGATGKFTIQGLDSDTYYLTETAAPDGYNKLADPVTITISAEGKINATEGNENGVPEVKILNQSGSELPSTGGMGTKIFYVVGSILVLGAAVLLITKKRMNAEK